MMWSEQEEKVGRGTRAFGTDDYYRRARKESNIYGVFLECEESKKKKATGKASTINNGVPTYCM